MIATLVLLLSLVGQLMATQQPTLENMILTVTEDFDTLTPESSTAGVFNRFAMTGNYVSTGRPYSAFVATFPPSRFAFYPSVPSGCVELVQPHISSNQTYNCEYATNGAFFTWDYTAPSLCVGNLVSDGKVYQLPTDGSGTKRANFGIRSDGAIMTGFFDQDTVNTTSFSQLITGYGWLVRNGVSNVLLSQDLGGFDSSTSFVNEKAPRTAVGVFKNGTMLLLEIDGEEDIYAGPDLFEMAELFVTLGVESAVNLDGGGSSVSVYEGTVIDYPTCNDTPEWCERAVANIACVKKA
jgi:N-acetylglucosamine-1-phosphodiester alpha-N-acetylglucosaminidase